MQYSYRGKQFASYLLKTDLRDKGRILPRNILEDMPCRRKGNFLRVEVEILKLFQFKMILKFLYKSLSTSRDPG